MAFHDDLIVSGAWLTAKLADDPAYTRADLAALLGVAVSMLAEQSKGGES